MPTTETGTAYEFANDQGDIASASDFQHCHETGQHTAAKAGTCARGREGL